MNFLRNKAVALFVALVCVCSIAGMVLSQQSVAAATTATTTDYLNLRAGPGTSYAVLSTLPEGTEVAVLDDSDPYWAEVKTPSGEQGWCSKEYLNITETKDSELTAVATDTLNLREGAGTSYNVISTISKGETVTVLDNQNSDWAKVKTSSGKEGWCSKEYLQFPETADEPKAAVVRAASQTAKTTDYVNLREGAGTSYDVIFTIPKGSTVTVLDSTSNKNWVKVQTSSGTQGWCSREYLEISTDSDSGSGITATTTAALNLRKGAGTSYDVILTMPKGSTVTILDNSNKDWAKVKTSSGEQGWCSKEYLQYSSDSGSSSSSKQTAKTTDYLNLRKGAGTSYDVILTIPKGSTVTVLDSTSNKAWAKVRTSAGVEGWCSKEYLQFSENSSSGNSGSSLTAKTTDYLNLRKGAGLEYDVIMTLAKGTTVTVLDNSKKDWAKVQTSSGTQGWCSKEYLQIGASSTPTPTPAPTASPTGKARTTDYLNLRKGPGTSYGVILTMEKGITVTVLDNTSNKDWAKVRMSSGTEGWCSKEYLSFSDEEKPETTVTAKTTDYLNLRKGAGTSYDVILTIPKGSTVTVLDKTSNKDWAKVRTSSGVEGWCSKEYLQFSDGSSSGGSTESPSEEYVQTITAVNFRTGPGTDYSVIRTLPTGTVLTVVSTSNPDWIQVEDSNGTKGYVSSEYVQPVSGDGTSITLSHTSVTLPALKTIYTTASSSSGADISWSSSNTKVATVQNGYIYGVAPGTATITASAAGSKVTCKVTVTAAEAVKSVYSDPNVVLAGESCNLVAITDSSREAVKFSVNSQNYTVTKYTSENVSADDGLAANNTRVWKQSVTFSEPGSYKVKVYSQQNGEMSSSYKEMTVFVVSTFDGNSSEERRISNEMLDIISEMEGYSAAVYPDTLAYNIPTLGYGHVLSKGEIFYNNLTKREAWALLCNTINTGSYTTEVNRFIQNNDLLASQSQFDSMVSFSYNVGAGYWNNSSAAFDLRKIILNAVEPPKIASGDSVSAKTTASVTVRKSADDSSSSVVSLSSGTAVQVTSTKFISSSNEMWYQVKTSAGKTGWVRGGYISFTNASSLTHNLKYTDAIAFGSEMLAWHKAGGNCLAGLLYRRLAEAKVYSYADYEAAHMSSPNYKKNTYGYHYPSCMTQYEQ